MSARPRYLIKFQYGDLERLRRRLLRDLSREHFAVLLGKTHRIDGYTIITVIDLLFLGRSDYNQQSVAFLRIKKDFIHRALVELTYKSDVHDQEMERVLALSDWMIVATDNHSSRLRAQQLSIQYFVPLLSVGVNITVKDNSVEDMSGEVITARVGDYLCLQCLNRINPIQVASERHPDTTIREALVRKR